MMSVNQSFQKDQQINQIADDTHQQFKPQSLRFAPIQRDSTEKDIPISNADIDNVSQGSYPGSQVFIDMEDKKSLTKKQKYLIYIGVLLAISIIVGGVVAYKVISDQNNSGPTIPKTYPQYEKTIQKGQEQNVVKLINVPKSQRIYNYVLANDQTTATDATTQSNTKSTVNHQFGLVCLDVNEFSFDMLIYFIDSKIQGDSASDVSSLTGYPKIKESGRRLLRNLEEDSTSSSSDTKKEQMENEFGILTENEIEMLKLQGITPEMFYSSNLPIIRFTMLKNGIISYVQQPINIRYDLHQIYLNILEQISPIVLKDFYNVNNKNRLLSAASKKFSQRILSNESVQPNYQAHIDENNVASLSKSFETQNLKNENKTRTLADYNQAASMKNGALHTSNVLSNFAIEDDLVDENDHAQPLFSKLQLNSNCVISFVQQEDIMNEAFLKTLIEDQENMSVLEMTWDEAITAYNNVFNYSKQVSQNTAAEEEGSHSGRLLQDTKTFAKSVTKPVFRKTYASMEFGADLKSECADSPNGGDICTVGLYSFFNGESIKLIEKQTSVNISQVLKIYQYINNILNDKILVVQQKIQQNIDTVSVALDDILTKVEQTIDIQKNPILNQVKSIVEDDKLNIINQIKQVESLINLSLSSVNQLIQDPLNTLKSRTFAYLKSKNIDIQKQVDEIQSFYMDKYGKIKDYIQQANKNGGLSANVKEQIKFLLDHHTQIIVQLVEQPVKNAMDQLESTILEQSDKIFNNATLVDQFINQNITSMVQNISNSVNLTALNLPIGNVNGFNITDQLSTIIAQIGGNDQIKAAISDAIKSIASNQDVINTLKSGLKQALDTTKTSIIAQLDQLNTTNSTDATNDQQRIDNFKTELNSVITFSTDLYYDIMKAKQNITDIANNIQNIKMNDVKNIALELSGALLNLPIDLAIKIKNDSIATALQLKQIGLKIFNDIMSWKNDLANDSKILLNQAQNVYAEVIEFLTKKDFPEDDPRFYQKPLFDDIQQSISGVQSLMNSKFQNVTGKYEHVKQIPAKFQQFVVDLKTLYQSSLAFANNITVTITSANIDTGLIGGYLTKILSGPKQQSETVVLASIEQEVTQPVARVATQALTMQVDQLVNQDLLNQFKNIVSGQEPDLKQIYKQVISQLIVASDFQKNFQFPNISLPIQYVYVYPTPIGVAIQLKLYAKWDTGIGLNFQYHNATLDFNSTVNTKVTVGGEVSASIVVAEVGGYAEGTFLETTLTAGVHLEVMNNYTGNYFIDGSFKPFDVRVGLYYQYYFPTEITKCGADIQPTPEEIANQTVDIKKSVQTTSNTFIKNIFSKVTSAINCLKTLKITPTRKDIFDPLTVKGDTYSKRLAEGTF